MLSTSQPDLIWKNLAVCDSKRAPEIGEGQAPYPPSPQIISPSFLAPSLYCLEKCLEQG